MEPRMLLDARDIVGESALWDHRAERLWWVDIVGRRLHRLDPATGEHDAFRAPDLVTSIGLAGDDGFVVGLARHVTLWRPGGEFRILCEVEPDLPGNRLNEGVVGPDGAFWVGTMQNNIAADGSPKEIEVASGRLYRVTADGGVHPLCDDRFGITNTMVWTDDGRFLTADTMQNAIYSYAMAGEGKLEGRRAVLSGLNRGLPDGSCGDAGGHVWNCRVAGGACLVRMSADGDIVGTVELPCSAPTSCAFGGPDLATLFVTSLRFGMSADHLAAHPGEGGLFAIEPGMHGRRANIMR